MQQKKKIFLLILTFVLLIAIIAAMTFIYKKDRNKYEPKLWIGMFDYRLNFRDLGESLNQCLNKKVFRTGLVYRSNKYFSGWSCDKIHNPQKIYSLNYSPNNPHAYFCYQKDGSRLHGIHPNTTFEISDIEDLSKWKNPAFKETMCSFFEDTLHDLVNKSSFLFHCDVGRDRTGTFAAMLAMMLAEQKNSQNEMIDAIECDYEKTHALEPFKKGKMKKFMQKMEIQGGVSQFIQIECGISNALLQQAADQFMY